MTRRQWVFASGILVAFLYIGWALLRPPPQITEPLREGGVQVTLDQRVVWRFDACVPLAWAVTGAERVYLEMDRVRAADSLLWCVDRVSGTTPTLTVESSPRDWRAYELQIVRGPYVLLRGVLVALAIGGGGWWLLQRDAKRVRHALVLAPWLLFVWGGLHGLDFGMHIDENNLAGPLTAGVVETGSLLPDWYGYPSAYFYLNTASLLPELTRIAAGETAPLLDALNAPPNPRITPDMRLRMRAVYLLLSSLTILWVYGLAYTWGRSVPAALLAASVVALSYEVLYHARFAAPDGVMTMLGALAAWLAVLSLRRPGFLWAAALVAGMGFGTKYNAGLLGLLPGVAALVLAWDARRSVMPWVRVALVPVGFAVGFILTTPGVILQAGVFYEDMTRMATHYGSRGHWTHTIASGWPHLWANLRYLFGVVPSPYLPVALALSGLSLLGVVVSLRRDWRVTLVLLSFPLAFVGYMSTQVVFFVRNLLIVVPFIAVFAGAGALAVAGWLQRRPLRIAWYAALALILLPNAVYVVWASNTVAERRVHGTLQPFVDYAARHPDTRFWISPGVLVWYAQEGRTLPPNLVVGLPENGDVAVFLLNDGHFELQTARGRLYVPRTVRTLGPHEINLNYYPDWWFGDNRVLMMDTRDFIATNLVNQIPEAVYLQYQRDAVEMRAPRSAAG